MKSENNNENSFLKIVPSYLHNSFTIVGEKLFNKIYFLLKDKDIDLRSLLIVCESILNEQKNLERNPEKTDSVFDFIVKESNNLNCLNYKNSEIKLNFLNDIYNLIQNTNPNCSLNDLLSKAHDELVQKNSDLKSTIINFEKAEKKLGLNFEQENYSILRNYFLNEQEVMNELNDNELRAVIGHEFAHIANRDILISTMVAAIAGAISTIAWISFWFSGRRGGGANLIVALIAPLAATIIQLAISRSREFQADWDGSIFSESPVDLAAALTKIHNSAHNQQLPVPQATAHLYIANPLKGDMSGLFSTHPKLEQRIERLKKMRPKNGN